MASGASLTLEDAKGRTPVDLLTGPVSQVVGKAPDSGIDCFLFLLHFGLTCTKIVID